MVGPYACDDGRAPVDGDERFRGSTTAAAARSRNMIESGLRGVSRCRRGAAPQPSTHLAQPHGAVISGETIRSHSHKNALNLFQPLNWVNSRAGWAQAGRVPHGAARGDQVGPGKRAGGATMSNAEVLDRAIATANANGWKGSAVYPEVYESPEQLIFSHDFARAL